jgi:putative flippase GtrA
MALENRVKKGIIQYATFNLIGISNGIVDLGSLNVLLFLWPTNLGWLLLLFNSIAYGLAVLNSYIWNARFTFRKNVKGGYRQKVLFVLQAAVSLGISNLTFLGAVRVFGSFGLPVFWVDNISKGLSMFFSATASFVFMKWIVFRRHKNED